ncbi:MAG: hypothetical protein IPP77_03255 [Bacteroidetes bacterium]|nr:hypothetical protein [Bacteroidota bacterium]
MSKTVLISLLASFTLFSCLKAPEFPVEPHLEFVSVSSSFLKSGYEDTITFSFTDGDGDIGIKISKDTTLCECCRLTSDDSTVLRNSNFNIFLIDNRDGCVQSFASANVSSNGKFPGIEGEIEVIRAVDTKKCLAPPQIGCPKDTAIFYVMMRDQAGHFSNFIQTTPIVVDGE